MLGLLAVTLPFFALVLAGFLAARRGVLPLEAVPGLNAFVLFFALPCMLYRFGSQMPVASLFDPQLFGLYLLCALVILGFTLAATLSPRLGLKDAAFGALVAAFPNSGFMGVPLITSLMTTQAAGPVINTLLVDLFITSSLALALAQARHTPAPETAGSGFVDSGDTPSAADTGGAGAALLRSLRAALGNPMPWSIALGGLASYLQFRLPGPVEKLVWMLADAASPVALFTIGAVLWRAQVAAEREDRAHHEAAGTGTLLARALPTALIKLLLHPLLVLVLGLAARHLGLPLSRFELTVLVLVAALPSASNVSLLTERYRADTGRVARIILVSTSLAFITFTTIAWLFGVR